MRVQGLFSYFTPSVHHLEISLSSGILSKSCEEETVQITSGFAQVDQCKLVAQNSKLPLSIILKLIQPLESYQIHRNMQIKKINVK